MEQCTMLLQLMFSAANHSYYRYKHIWTYLVTYLVTYLLTYLLTYLDLFSSIYLLSLATIDPHGIYRTSWLK